MSAAGVPKQIRRSYEPPACGLRLVRLVCAIELEMRHQAARVSARTEFMVQRMMRAATDWDRLHVPADASVNKIRRLVDFPAVKAEETMFPISVAVTAHLA